MNYKGTRLVYTAESKALCTAEIAVHIPFGFVPLKVDLFAKSGKLLKRTTLSDIVKINERWFPKKILFKDMLKKGDGTEFIIEEIDFNIEIPEYLLTKASLKR